MEILASKQVAFTAENDADRKFFGLLMEGKIWELTRGKFQPGVEINKSQEALSILVTVKDAEKIKT